MGGFLQRFWAAAASLAGVVGLYLTAEAADLLWTFWVVVGASALIASVLTFGKRGLELAIRVRNYPALLSRVATLTDELEAAKVAAERASAQATSQWNDGVKEGQDRVRGALLSRLGQPPILTSIASYKGGVVLVGHRAGQDGKHPRAGARYRLELEATGELKGIVQVVETDAEQDAVLLRCVEPTVERFWGHLTDRVDYDSSAPPGVVLAPYAVKDASFGAPEPLDEEPAPEEGA